MEEIIDNLYLGSFSEVQDIKSKISTGFVACLTVGKQFSLHDIEETYTDGLEIGLPNLKSMGISPIRIPIDDGQDGVICHYIPKAISFIDEHIEKGKVYVHCYAGISRSASIVFAYLLSKGHDPIKAFELMTSKRGQVFPYYVFISEILAHFKIANADKVMKELKYNLYKAPYKTSFFS